MYNNCYLLIVPPLAYNSYLFGHLSWSIMSKPRDVMMPILSFVAVVIWWLDHTWPRPDFLVICHDRPCQSRELSWCQFCLLLLLLFVDWTTLGLDLIFLVICHDRLCQSQELSWCQLCSYCYFFYCTTLGLNLIFLVHDDVIKWKYFPHWWPFVRGIHRSPVNSPHKGQWRGALIFSLICAWIHGRVNYRETGDLGRHRTHYDVNVLHLSWSIMSKPIVVMLQINQLAAPKVILTTISGATGDKNLALRQLSVSVVLSCPLVVSCQTPHGMKTILSIPWFTTSP